MQQNELTLTIFGEWLHFVRTTLIAVGASSSIILVRTLTANCVSLLRPLLVTTVCGRYA